MSEAARRIIKDYQKDLSRELGDVDQALKVEALDDAEEFFEEMAQDLLDSGSARDREQALLRAVRSYGRPRTVAREYLRRSTEEERRPAERMDGPLSGILGVYVHRETYLGLIYLLLMFPLGIAMFAYIVTGISLGLGLLVTIIGIPLLVLFLISIYGISYLLGRFTELMLGIRMPRKRRKMYLVGRNWTKLKTMLKDWRLYSSMFFLLLTFPLGILYFTVLSISFALSAALILLPLVHFIGWMTDIGEIFVSDGAFVLFTAIASLAGFVLLTWTLHLSNILWYLHGRLARMMLLKI